MEKCFSDTKTTERTRALSLLDTAGMKVREWYVTYHDRPPDNMWVFNHLKPGFRHVELAKELRYGPGANDVGWLLYLPTYEMLEVDLCVDPRPPWVRCPNATVQKVTTVCPLMGMRSWWDMGPPTCVEAAKWALGIRSFFTRTPWQLHEYIRKRNGVLINEQRRWRRTRDAATAAAPNRTVAHECEPQP